jgi:hypothetical protein
LFASGGIVFERKNKPIAFEFTNGPPTAGKAIDSCSSLSGSVAVERNNKPIAIELTNYPPIAGQVTDSCISVPGGTSAQGGTRWEA